MAISIVCRQCGSSFESSPSRAKKFCCVGCFRAAQKEISLKNASDPARYRAVCAHCGAGSVRLPGKNRNGADSENVFCGKVCYDAFRAAVTAKTKASTPDFFCGGCGVGYQSHYSQSKFCSMACRKDAKRVTAKHCPNCNCLFTPVKPGKDGKFIGNTAGKTCSPYCHNQWIRNNPERKRKIGDAFRGTNHPNWQGGKSLLNNTSNRGPNWQKQRAKALARDKACVDCGIDAAACVAKFGRSLDVDHVVPYHNFTNYLKANALSNLQCRCASCHRVAESKRGMVQMVLPMQSNAKRHQKGYVRGERVNTAKINAQQVIEIRKMHGGGTCRHAIADFFGISFAIVQQVSSGRTWKHLLPFSK